MVQAVKLTVFCVCLLCATGTPAAVQQKNAATNDAQAVYTRFMERYLQGESVRIAFSDANVPGMRGTITIKRGNRFILEAGGRFIYCNGQNLWNYHPPTKKVLLSSYSATEKVFSPEKMFLRFPTEYIPTLERESQSSGLKYLVLSLRPKSKEAMIGSLAHIVLRLNPQDLRPREVEASDGTTTSHWHIENIDTDVAIKDSAFEPVFPDDVRVIDLR